MVVPSAVAPLLRELGQIADGLALPAYAVGGCVRDWLLGIKKTADLDVTVEGNGLILARQAAAALKAELTEHQQFGTATLELPGKANQRIDVSSCRKEAYSQPAAYPKVTPGALQDDLFRRDFTINAMAVSINRKTFGHCVDPFKGREDLGKGCLRVLHEGSFSDDPSRILRGIRFLKRFDLHWDPRTRELTLKAIADGELGRLNAGRLARELGHMADEPNPKACFNALAEMLDAAIKLS